MDIVKDLLGDIFSGFTETLKETAKGVVSDISQELKPSTEETKGIGDDCKTQTDCSITGIAGGKRTSNLFSPIGCCEGKCTFKREDYLGVGFCPNECKSGGLFDKPGTCKPTMREIKFLSELSKEEKNVVKAETKEEKESKEIKKISKLLSNKPKKKKI